MKNQSRHENYEILNLIGYGLAKFGKQFVRSFGYTAKSTFYDFIVEHKIADTAGVVKNRQDLFDPFFDNGRRGWWQKGDAYIHRKNSIDAFYGKLTVEDYADIVKMYLNEKYGIVDMPSKAISPVKKSQFKQLQETGYGAEIFFQKNYKQIPSFARGKLQDARMLGDGYDFQISVKEQFFLAEVKGIQSESGPIRLTKNEFEKAREYADEYALVVVANLHDIPRMHPVFNPANEMDFAKKRLPRISFITTPNSHRKVKTTRLFAESPGTLLPSKINRCRA